MGFLAVQLTAGVGVLMRPPHVVYCFGWGVASLALVVMYPLMKQFTRRFPQLVLGLTFIGGAHEQWFIP